MTKKAPSKGLEKNFLTGGRISKKVKEYLARRYIGNMRKKKSRPLSRIAPRTWGERKGEGVVLLVFRGLLGGEAEKIA